MFNTYFVSVFELIRVRIPSLCALKEKMEFQSYTCTESRVNTTGNKVERQFIYWRIYYASVLLDKVEEITGASDGGRYGQFCPFRRSKA